ncbi:MAG: glycosyltransferase, partial [Planctomycetota bacterium]|nr:glycosyltransferase [Planctomycetota bacterium]
IKSNIRVKYNKIYNRNYYTLALTREFSDIFSKRIRFVSIRKNEKLDTITSKRHSNAFKKYDWMEEVADISYDIQDVYDVEVFEQHFYLANGFTNHNSNLKWLEYSARKIPTIATDIECYNQDIKQGETGYLCKSPNDWIAALSELIEDKGKRRKMGQNAYDDVKAKYNIKNNAHKYFKAYSDIIDNFTKKEENYAIQEQKSSKILVSVSS